MGSHINFNGDAPFDMLEEKPAEDNSHFIKIKLKEQATANDVLQYIIPKGQVNMLREVVPSMNEIFIEKVNQIS